MEGLEERINLPVQELTCLLETEVRGLKEDNDKQMSELKQRFDEFENCDVVNINRRLGTARSKINEIIEKTSELGLQIKEIHRDKASNLLIHGLPCPGRWSWRTEVKGFFCLTINSLGRRVLRAVGQDDLLDDEDQAGDRAGDVPGGRPQAELHQGGGQQLPAHPRHLRASSRQRHRPRQDFLSRQNFRDRGEQLQIYIRLWSAKHIFI